MKTLLIIGMLVLSASSGLAEPLAEHWAYLMKGEERFFPAASPITDVGCFSAAINADGHLAGGHMTPPRPPGARPGTRYHLVVTMPWNKSLAHIYLDPKLPFRQRILNDIVQRCQPFDGVQIDIEGVAAEDKARYIRFLAAVKKALPRHKIFSVAVLARWAEHKRKNPDDAFDYAVIGQLADRVVVMAYDEHYGGGAAGPIASLPWCRGILDHAAATIPREKIIMGVPLYGRAWQTEKLAKAYKNREVVDELSAKGIRPRRDTAEGGSYRFHETVEVRVHYETVPSLQAKLALYRGRSIRGAAFWRLGQEPDGFWSALAPAR